MQFFSKCATLTAVDKSPPTGKFTGGKQVIYALILNIVCVKIINTIRIPRRTSCRFVRIAKTGVVMQRICPPVMVAWHKQKHITKRDVFFLGHTWAKAKRAKGKGHWTGLNLNRQGQQCCTCTPRERTIREIPDRHIDFNKISTVPCILWTKTISVKIVTQNLLCVKRWYKNRECNNYRRSNNKRSISFSDCCNIEMSGFAFIKTVDSTSC